MASSSLAAETITATGKMSIGNNTPTVDGMNDSQAWWRQQLSTTGRTLANKTTGHAKSSNRNSER
jgi:hypothetical protein